MAASRDDIVLPTEGTVEIPETVETSGSSALNSENLPGASSNAVKSSPPIKACILGSPPVPALACTLFAEGHKENIEVPVSPPVPAAASMLLTTTATVDQMTEFAQPETQVNEVEDTRPLATRFVDKIWRVRNKAYVELKDMIEVESGTKEDIFCTFAPLMANAASDSSPAALDTGLTMLLAFTEKAPVAALQIIIEQYITKIATAVIDSTFSARKELQSKGQALLLKLVEVDEPSAIVTVLLSRLGDKKPKIPPTCAETLSMCLQYFGAPAMSIKLPAIIQALPKILDSSNGALREQVMILLVELARWIGAAPLQHIVLDKLRSAQKTEFDRLLAESTQDTPVPTVWLRKARPTQRDDDVSSQSDASGGVRGKATTSKSAVGSMTINTRDLIAAVDICAMLKPTEFHRLVKEEKWSEQLRGMQLVIDLLGPEPKIVSGSDVSAIIAACKKFLLQGHVAVQMAALKVLGLLADGLQAEFGPLVRSLVQSIVSKCREKKLAADMQATLVRIIHHCLTMESVCTDFCENISSKKVPAAGRVGLIDVVVSLLNTVPDRVNEVSLKAVATVVVSACDDADSTVRESCTTALTAMLIAAQSRGKRGEDTVKVINALELTNAKLFKRIISGSKNTSTTSKIVLSNVSSAGTAPNLISSRPPATSPVKTSVSHAKVANSPAKTSAAVVHNNANVNASANANVASPSKGKKASPVKESGINSDLNEEPEMDLEAALLALNVLKVEGWNDSVQMMMDSSKWNEKVDALTLITTQMASLELGGQLSKPLVTYLNNKTNGLKISNVNVSKAVLTLCTAAAQHPGTEPWHRPSAARLITTLADRLADRKQNDETQKFFTALCEAISPAFVLGRLSRVLETNKAPVFIQSFYEWAIILIGEFGMTSMPAPTLAKLCEPGLAHKMPFVRAAATTLLGAMFHQLGPRVQGLLGPLQSAQQTALDAEFAKVGYEPTAVNAKSNRVAKGADPTDISCIATVPRQDLLILLNKSVPVDLVCVEGKTSWQGRKAALEAIITACTSSGHYLEYTKATVDLLRAVKSRLSDTQANLKPLAAQAMRAMLVSFDTKSTAKALSAVGAVLLGGVSDNKKPMRDASLAALDAVVTQNVTGAAAEPSLVSALIPALAEVLANPTGRIDILGWMLQHGDAFRVDTNTCDLAGPLVIALQDKQAPVRAAAETMLIKFAQQKCITLCAFDKATRDFSTATKRSFQGSLDRVNSILEPSCSDETAPAQRLGAAERLVKAPEPPAPSLGTAQRKETSKVATKTSVFTSNNTHVHVHVPTATAESASTVATLTAVEDSGDASSILRKTHKNIRLEDRKLHWPTDNDIGETEFLSLQSQWEPLIVGQALKEKLFPSPRDGPGVLYNQDNLIAALDELPLLCRDVNFMQHLDLIFRWLSYALCVRETSTGLLRVLHAIFEVVQFVTQDTSTLLPLADAEISLLLPHLIEHCGHKSERHKAAFRIALEAMCSVTSSKTYQLSLLSGLSCKNKRTRVVCLEELALRVAATGYTSLGRAGVKDIGAFLDARDGDMAGRNACLDLCLHLYAAMGSDIQKLFKNLGDLSERARSQVEARIKHTGGSNSSSNTQKEPGSNNSTPAKTNTNANSNHAATVVGGGKKRASPALDKATRKASVSLAVDTSNNDSTQGDSPFRLEMTPPEQSGSKARKRFGVDTSFDTTAMDAKLTELSAVMTSLNMSMTPGQLLSPRAKAKARQSTLPDENMRARMSGGSSHSPVDSSPHVTSRRSSTKSSKEERRHSGGGIPKKKGSRLSSGSQGTPSPANSPAVTAEQLPVQEQEVVGGDDIYADIMRKMDSLLYNIPDERTHDDATDYIKILHSIASGTWSTEEQAKAADALDLRKHAQALLSRLVGCVGIAFSVKEFISPVKSPGSGLKIDISLASASLATIFAILRQPNIIASLNMSVCTDVLQSCLSHLVDSRLATGSVIASKQGKEGESGIVTMSSADIETAEQIVRALNIIALKLAAEMPPIKAMVTLLGVVDASAQGNVAILAVKPASKLLLRVLGEEMRSSKPFQSNPQDTALLLQKITILFSSLDARTAHEAAFGCGKTVLKELVTSLGGRHVLAALQTQGASSSSSVVKLTAKLSGISVEAPSELQEHIISVLDDIARSRDKKIPLDALWALQQQHPGLDVQQYGSHLSTAHRRFIADKMAVLQAKSKLQTQTHSPSTTAAVYVAKPKVATSSPAVHIPTTTSTRTTRTPTGDENATTSSLSSTGGSRNSNASSSSNSSRDRTSTGSANGSGSSRKSSKKKRRSSGIGKGGLSPDDNTTTSASVISTSISTSALQPRRASLDNIPSPPNASNANSLKATLPPAPPVTITVPVPDATPALVPTGGADSDLMARFARLKSMSMTNKV